MAYDSADRPAIEVSPAAIAAGLDVYLSYCPDTGVGDVADERMVAAIYAAMIAKSEASPNLPVHLRLPCASRQPRSAG